MPAHVDWRALADAHWLASAERRLDAPQSDAARCGRAADLCVRAGRRGELACAELGGYRRSDTRTSPAARVGPATRVPTRRSGAFRRFGEVATIGVGRLPTSVAVDQHTGTVWVVNSLDGTVSEISEARRAVVATIKVCVSPVGVAADPKTGTVWVTCLGPFNRPGQDDTVAMISEATGRWWRESRSAGLRSGSPPDPRTGTVWVANANSYSVSEISEAHRDRWWRRCRPGTDGAPDSVAVDSGARPGLDRQARRRRRRDQRGDEVGGRDGAGRSRPEGATRSTRSPSIPASERRGWPADYYDGSNYHSYASQLDQVRRKVLRQRPGPQGPAWSATSPTGSPSTRPPAPPGSPRTARTPSP